MAFLALEMEVSWFREMSGQSHLEIVVLYGLSVSAPRPNRACRNAWLSLLAAYMSWTRASMPTRSKSANFVFTSLQLGAAFLTLSVAMARPHKKLVNGWCHGKF